MTPTPSRRCGCRDGHNARLCQRPGCEEHATVTFGSHDMRVTRDTVAVCAGHQRWGRSAFVRGVNQRAWRMQAS